MLTKLEIKNYKSICNATVELSPFTLLIGANGAGKTNFISLLRDLHHLYEGFDHGGSGLKKHLGLFNEKQLIELTTSQGDKVIFDGEKKGFVVEESENTSKNFQSNEDDNEEEDFLLFLSPTLPGLSNVRVFNLDPSSPGKEEALAEWPSIYSDGSGVVQVLDALKTGDREDLFILIEKKLGEYIPEIEKLIFAPGKGGKSLQVREKYLPKPIPVSALSEGTRFVLTILTILYQEHPPSLICIEDIDRGFHPRLFQQMVELCNDLSRELDVQIIATTHNPYILDEFKGNESAVVIVEKKEGCTTFTTLAERLAQIEADGEEEEMPLGSLWYSGLVGGVPRR